MPVPTETSHTLDLPSPTSPSTSAFHSVPPTPKADPYDASKSTPAPIGAPSTYPPLTSHPMSWLRYAVHYITDRDYNLWIMTFAFVLLFFAYPIQGVQTIRYPATGSYILLILYGFYGITSLFASPFIDLMGPEWCMPFGALTYALWIASEFSGNDGLVLAGAAAFGWGAGIMWPAAGTILATISTPHNRGSNNGIFALGFHLGVFSGGLTLSGVISAFSSYDSQYGVFLGLCTASFITFLVFIVTFRARYRVKKPAPAVAATVVPSKLFRVVHDDGTEEYREQLDGTTLCNAEVVVVDLALTGGRTGPKPKLTLASLRARLYESIKFLWNPVFAPCALVVASIGGVNQGWFNASFNQMANKAGDQWVGWIYAIAESFSITSAIVFGLFYDHLRKHYKAEQYRWVMYYAFFAVFAMCGCAMGCAYLYERDLGYGPGEVHPAYYRGLLIVTSFFYSTSWLALELSIYTYLTTFMVYNADIGFSTKVFCEACGYMISYGLVDVLGPRDMVIVLFCCHLPAAISYLVFFRAPDTAAPVLKDDVKGTELAALPVGDVGKDGLKHTSSQFDLVKGVEKAEDEQKEEPKEEVV